MPTNAAAPAGRANVLPVSRQLLLLTLCALYLRASDGQESATTQTPLPEESSTTKITEGPETSSESPSKPNETDLQNSSTSNRSRGAARFVLHTRALPWLEALEACQRAGQRLAVPRNAPEAQHLGGLLAAALAANASALQGTAMRDALHVGLNDLAHEGRWITTQGEALAARGYGVWLSAGAANNVRRNCGALLVEDGRFVAQRCAAALAFACEPPPPARTGKGDGYHAVQGLAMYKLHGTARSWVKAAATCAREGAALAAPDTAREAGLLAGMMMARPQLRQSGVFVGINDLADEGEWRNYDGTRLSDTGYNLWAPGEPSGERAENCGMLQADGHLADAPCSEPRAFFCRRAEAGRGGAAYAAKRGVQGSWRLQREGRDWAAALLHCARDNASLAVANSSREARALAAIFADARASLRGVRDTDYMHVGAIRWAGADSARAVNGQPLDSNIDWYYYSNQPNGEEDRCVMMDTSGRYHCSSCDIKRAFICIKYS